MPRPSYPTLERWLDTLPSGLGSFPECRARAALLSEALRDRPLALHDERLPARLRALVTAPPAPEQWVSEVELHAFNLAVFDQHFASAGLAGYLQWNRLRNRRLLEHSLFRPLFWLTPPARLGVGIERRWQQFRRGTQLTLLEASAHRITARLLHAPGLFETVNLEGVGAAFCATVELCGGRNVRARGQLLEARTSELSLSWE